MCISLFFFLPRPKPLFITNRYRMRSTTATTPKWLHKSFSSISFSSFRMHSDMDIVRCMQCKSLPWRKQCNAQDPINTFAAPLVNDKNHRTERGWAASEWARCGSWKKDEQTLYFSNLHNWYSVGCFLVHADFRRLFPIRSIGPTSLSPSMVDDAQCKSIDRTENMDAHGLVQHKFNSNRIIDECSVWWRT